MERYEEVDRKVAPKREALRKADKQYQSLMGELRKKQEALRGVQEELAGLQAELDTVRKEKTELEQTVCIWVHTSFSQNFPYILPLPFSHILSHTNVDLHAHTHTNTNTHTHTHTHTHIYIYI